MATARRRVRRYDGLLRRTYPLRGRALRAWLRGPTGAAAGVFFLSAIDGGGARCGPVMAATIVVTPLRLLWQVRG